MNKSLRSSSIPMQMRCSSLNGHTPQTQGTPKAAGDLNEIWYDAENACPWLMEKYERALNYDLPKPVAQALDGWMKASQATAVITALLAGVQGGMIAVIEALPDSDDSPVWRTFRGFVYAGLCFDLGATLSSVYIIVQGAALPVLARRKAMATCASKSTPYLQIHEPDHMIPRYHLDGWHGVQILEEFGMDQLWRYVAHHMLWNFVLGYICLIMSIILWVCGKESTALVVPIVVVAVGTAGPVYGFLRFVIPL